MKLRKIVSLLFIVLPLLISSGCNDWLELAPPDGLVKDEYWKSKEDIEAVLMGAYQQFAQLDERLFLYGELRGDLLTDDSNTPGYQRLIMEANIYPDNALCDWNDFYLVINYCNLVLKYIPIIQETDQTFSNIQSLGFEAEALYLRGLAYFYLVRIWKEVPLILDASEEDDVDFYLPKSTEEEVLTAIEEDLKRTLGFVTDEYGTLEQNKGRANRGAILALLADINLWQYEYDEVIDYVERIEDLEYFLLPAAQWFDNFFPGNSLSSIFEFQFNSSLEQPSDLFFYTYFNIGYYKASETALELLAPERSGEIYRGRGSLRGTDGAIWKYCGSAPDEQTLRPSSETRDANWIVYRYADVLLMKAEALSQTGRYQDALTIINEIRTQALVSPLSLDETAEAFENAIMDERVRELAFEGKRWFDLVRLGRRNNYARKNYLIEIIIDKVPSTQKLVLATKLTDPFSWFLPIQEDELERNNQLVQNPYYAVFSDEN